MNRLQKLFKHKSGSDLLSIYVTAGYPKLDAMPELIPLLAENGVDFIEAGMPYSDPLADGKTIQHSSSLALQNGMNLELYFRQIKQVRRQTNIPILFMGYFNQVLKFGVDKFLQACTDAGIDGVILPDLPPEIYQKSYRDIFEKYDLGMSFLISPTTADERIRLIDSLTSAFIYVVSASSTTGKTEDFTEEQIAYFKRIRDFATQNPKVIGFGIDKPQKYRIANTYADGAIIGSAFIKAIAGEDYRKNAVEFVHRIKRGRR